MVKRILASLLAVTLALLCFGCGAKHTGDPKSGETAAEVADGSKIALIVGTAAQEPELAAAAQSLAALYGDALVQLHYPSDYAQDETALTAVADQAVKDEAVKAVIFAGGVNGTAAAAARVRALREDMCIIVCNPIEGVDRVRLTANLVFSLDFAAFADALVRNAKAMGAENLVFFTTDRELKLAVPAELRTAAESACKAQKLTFKAVTSVDIYEKGKTADLAKQYIAEDVERRAEQLGKKTAFFATQPIVQGALAKAAAAQQVLMPAAYLPSPIALASELGADLTGHETDSAFALKALQDAAADNGTKGRVAVWGFSEPAAALLAAMDYAAAFTSGDAGLMADGEQITGFVRAHTDVPFTFADSGFSNVFLFRSDALTL